MGSLPRGCFPSPVPSSLSTDFISVMHNCFSPFRREAHGWVARIFQLLEQSPSRDLLSIVVAGSGCLRLQPPFCEAVVNLLIGIELTVPHIPLVLLSAHVCIPSQLIQSGMCEDHKQHQKILWLCLGEY